MSAAVMVVAVEVVVAVVVALVGLVVEVVAAVVVSAVVVCRWLDASSQLSLVAAEHRAQDTSTERPKRNALHAPKQNSNTAVGSLDPHFRIMALVWAAQVVISKARRSKGCAPTRQVERHPPAPRGHRGRASRPPSSGGPRGWRRPGGRGNGCGRRRE